MLHWGKSFRTYSLFASERMASRALYLKWRPQTFEEVIGQEPVTRTLRAAVEQGKIAHAYLFCGPRGTGKTSTARILAKAVNCVGEPPRPCNACDICRAVNDGALIDLIEIDAASHTGVDNIRDLRDKAGFRPNLARYKVYIIDEVHMLSKSAFNALLKTLEEPPPHVIFILATTEPHEVPATVISRCQRFDFRYVPAGVIAERLRLVAEAEGLRITQEALETIAAHAAGGVRDAISLLDQLTAYSDVEITVDQVRALLGIGSVDLAARLVDALLRRDLRAGLEVIDALVEQGVPLRQFNAELLEYLRGMLLVKARGESQLLQMNPEARRRLEDQAEKADLREWSRWVELFSQSAQSLKTTLQPQLPLELALVEALEPAGAQALEPRPMPAREAAPAAAPKSAPTVAPAPSPESSLGREETTPTPGRAPAEGELLAIVQAQWQDVLRVVRPLDKNAEAFLRAAQPAEIHDDQLILAFVHEFHKKRFESENCVAVAERALEEVLGRRLRIQCRLASGAPTAKGRSAAAQPQSLAAPKMSQANTSGPEDGNPPAAPPKQEAAPHEKAAPSPTEDPLIRSAVENLGARVVDVLPAEADAGAQPWPDETPPPEDDF